ncbi:MAG: hypothetical protein KZQ60_00580 [Candidatus Thiodiazotropha sp. (ex Lucinoma aequizonata)]|nr:hypothetical protein [Candidatus Thiodiazotropha sp. (ex Lucinoma aequizonata)]
MRSLYALHLSLSVAIPAIQSRLRLSGTNRLRSAFHGGQRAKLATDPSKLLMIGLVLMWVAVILSAAVDNIPFTVTMIPIILGLEGSGVNIAPLWWALALGVGLGGNGTHIGATANIIAVSELEKSGMPEAKVTLLQWMRTGMPVMFFGLLLANVFYLLFFELFTTI